MCDHVCETPVYPRLLRVTCHNLKYALWSLILSIGTLQKLWKWTNGHTPVNTASLKDRLIKPHPPLPPEKQQKQITYVLGYRPFPLFSPSTLVYGIWYLQGFHSQLSHECSVSFLLFWCCWLDYRWNQPPTCCIPEQSLHTLVIHLSACWVLLYQW